jgi:hypothetical protein
VIVSLNIINTLKAAYLIVVVHRALHSALTLASLVRAAVLVHCLGRSIVVYYTPLNGGVDSYWASSTIRCVHHLLRIFTGVLELRHCALSQIVCILRLLASYNLLSGLGVNLLLGRYLR